MPLLYRSNRTPHGHARSKSRRSWTAREHTYGGSCSFVGLINDDKAPSCHQNRHDTREADGHRHCISPSDPCSVVLLKRWLETFAELGAFVHEDGSPWRLSKAEAGRIGAIHRFYLVDLIEANLFCPANGKHPFAFVPAEFEKRKLIEAEKRRAARTAGSRSPSGRTRSRTRPGGSRRVASPT